MQFWLVNFLLDIVILISFRNIIEWKIAIEVHREVEIKIYVLKMRGKSQIRRFIHEYYRLQRTETFKLAVVSNANGHKMSKSMFIYDPRS